MDSRITIFKVLNILSLIGITVWLVKDFSWEAVVTFLSFLSSYIYLEIKDNCSDNTFADKKLFEKFNKELPYYSISFIESQSLRSLYRYEKLDPFFNLEVAWDNVHNVFHNKKIEKKKKKLFKAIEIFTSLVAENTFETDKSDLYCIPREWEREDKVAYDNICNDIDTAQNNVVDTYDEFVKTTKIILNV